MSKSQPKVYGKKQDVEIPAPKPVLKFKKLTDNAIMFKRSRDGDAGYDVYCNEDFDLLNGQRKLVSTGVAIKIPAGYVGILKSRSGIAAKLSTDVEAGVIDENYTGEIKVLLDSGGCNSFNAGDRIAQIIFVKYESFPFEEVDELEETNRGDNGFLSSGIK